MTWAVKRILPVLRSLSKPIATIGPISLNSFLSQHPTKNKTQMKIRQQKAAQDRSPFVVYTNILPASSSF